MKTKVLIKIMALSIAAALASCQSIDDSQKRIQFCLSTGNGGADELKKVLRELALVENIEYFDWSRETQRQLEALDSKRFPVENSLPLINIGLRRQDGLGIGGENAGLPANQVSFAFTNGRNRAEGRRFAQRVIKRLERTWKVDQIPKNRASAPLARCA